MPTNAARLADFGSGIGTEGAVLEVDNANKRIGLGTTNPNCTVQIGAVGAAGTSLFVDADAHVGGALTVGGNISVAGTITYNDVTSVDSVGMVTAGTGVRVTTGGIVVTAGISTLAGTIVSGITTIDGSGVNVTGVVTATEYYGDGQYLDNVGIPGISTTGTSYMNNIYSPSGIGTFSELEGNFVLDCYLFN